MKNFVIRKAMPEDSELILDFIKQLAEYEKLLDSVIATPTDIHNSIFVNNYAHALIAEEEGKPVGFAIYFFNFSTFEGKPGLYLEDLFVNPEFRGKGYGKALLIFLAKLAVEKHCGRFEWSVLDWNKPAIDFYLGLGAKPMDEWTVFRVDGDNLINLANK